MSGWPSDVPEDEDLNPYYRRCFELGMEVVCLFWGPSVVIPKQYRAKVLMELHLSLTYHRNWHLVYMTIVV